MMRLEKAKYFGIATLLLLGSLHTQAATQYKIEDLGEIPAGTNKTISINNNGDYTISLQNDFGGASTYLISNGVKQEIGADGKTSVNALNDKNQATGSNIVDYISNKRSAFLYLDGNTINIETLDVSESTGYDINNDALVGGEVTLNDSFGRRSEKAAFIYDYRSGQMVLLKDHIRPFLPLQSPYICDFECWEFSHVKGINSQGMITGLAYPVGTADDFPSSFLGKLRAFLFDGQTLISLGTLGGDMSFGQAINDHGHVAGISDRIHETLGGTFPSDPDLITQPPEPEPDPLHVFLYDGSSMKDLGILDGGLYSEVTALNNNDEIVGAVTFNGYKHAFKATQNRLVDLNSLISDSAEWSELTVATDINDNGVIVGYGQKNGMTHGFKLVPVEKSEIACFHVSAEICTKILSKTQ